MKKNILYLFLPFLKLKSNQSLYKKIFIYIDIMITAYVYMVIFLYFFSQVFYPYKLKYNNITYYSFENISDNKYFIDTIKKVNKKILLHEIYDESLEIEIFFPNSEIIYSIYRPWELLPAKNTYAATLGSKILIKMADFNKNLVFSDMKNSFPNELDRILVHEIMHVMQIRKYGFIKLYTSVPYWVREGYPIYISGESTYYDEDKFLRQVLNKDFDALTTFEKDFLFGQIVKYAIESLNASIDDLHNGNIDFNKIKKEFLIQLIIKNEAK